MAVTLICRVHCGPANELIVSENFRNSETIPRSQSFCDCARGNVYVAQVAFKTFLFCGVILHVIMICGHIVVKKFQSMISQPRIYFRLFSECDVIPWIDKTVTYSIICDIGGNSSSQTTSQQTMT